MYSLPSENREFPFQRRKVPKKYQRVKDCAIDAAQSLEMRITQEYFATCKVNFLLTLDNLLLSQYSIVKLYFFQLKRIENLAKGK